MDAGLLDRLHSLVDGSLTTTDIWLIIGFGGQMVFFMRFLIQWIVSERTGRSVIPDVFWYFSIMGGIILLAYAFHRNDPVFIMGQAVGLLVYFRNVMLLQKEQSAGEKV